MAPLYNHGHADALSITLTKDGRAIFVDPGTYRYNGVPEWRSYFRGTRAHNTVAIDGMDQAVQETGFIWSRPYKSELLSVIEHGDRVSIEATHDGYSRLKEHVKHKRSVLFFEKTNFRIKDTFSGEGIHDFELNYHLHPDALVTKNGGWWLIDCQGTKVFIRLEGECDFLFVRGQEDPLLGWYSSSYGEKRKSGVLSYKKIGSVNEVSFFTEISAGS